MKVCARIALVVVSILLVFPAIPGAQASVKKTAGGLLAVLKPGHWIQLEGTPQKDHTILCGVVKQLTGDFLDDDWSVRGVIARMDRGKHGFQIGDFTILVSENAVFDLAGALDGYDELKVGMLVEVEGKYRRDGTFLALEVDDESDKTGKRGIVQRIQIVGRVERVDVAKGRITTMGRVFQVTDKTQMKSTLR